MQPTLIILAAGMGSRYGGLKQLEAVGPSGETIMDYSVYDARRAGFGKVVFIIRPDMEAAFRAAIGSRYERHIPVEYAFQRLEDLPAGHTAPPGRTKPWGTAHAILAAADRVNEPFAVINADDFYGANSFATLAEFLTTRVAQASRLCESDGACVAEPATYAMVGYTLRDTLTVAGTVNRGVCRCDTDGWLQEITEIINIEPDGAGACYPDQSGGTGTLTGNEPVSMNFWGFRPVFFEQLRAYFEEFLRSNADSLKAEFYIPISIQDLIRAGRARVKVLPTSAHWCGVTHKEDLPRVVRMIAELVDADHYPHQLWA
ncbi:MAG: NTP transferase domain-containing protein [Planctomycetota bacterium]